VVESSEALVPHREVEGMDPVVMLFTSGTSGDPKAVRFAHAMAVMCGSSLAERFEMTADDVCYLSMPLFHSNGVAAGWAVALACGATMVPEKFSPSRFLPDIRRYGATYMNYVGKPLAMVLGTPRNRTTPTTHCGRRSGTRPRSATRRSSRGGSAVAWWIASGRASSPSS
jgi:fatty-acyl-CoA synthase